MVPVQQNLARLQVLWLHRQLQVEDRERLEPEVNSTTAKSQLKVD